MTLKSIVRRLRDRIGENRSQAIGRARVQPLFERLEGRALLSVDAINEFPIATAGALPSGISSGIVSAPGGGIWFTEPGANKIGSVAAAGGAPKEYAIPTASSGPQSITLGPDGNLWFTEINANQIGRIAPVDTTTLTDVTVPSGATVTTPGAGGVKYSSGMTIPAGTSLPAGTITEFTIGTANSRPSGITAGPDGNIWFTESATGKIGLMNPTSGFVNDFALKTPGGQPSGITSGPNGNLWFTLPAINEIGAINTVTLVDNEFPINTPGASPQGSLPQSITLGPDGNLWFSEAGAALLGKISPTTQAVTQYAVPSPGGVTQGITTGSDGNVWCTEPGTSRLGRITPDGAVTEFNTKTQPSGPWGVTNGPDGNVWFTEAGANQIGQLVLAKLIAVTPIAVTTQVNSTSTLTVASFESAQLNPQTGSFTANIDWGDGTNTPSATISAVGAGVFTVSASKKYSTVGPYSAQLTILDTGGATAATVVPINVANDATGYVLSPAPVEGQAFSGTKVATFIDPLTTGQVAQYTATIDWGDKSDTSAGTIIYLGGNSFEVTGGHTYTDEGPKTVTVTVTGSDSRTFVALSQAAVADAPLNASGTPFGATAGIPFTGLVATFSDENPNATTADFRATISWGDGHVSNGSIDAPAGAGYFTVTGSNTYAIAGPAFVSVTITDVGGSTVTTNLTANTVGNGSSELSGHLVSPSGFSGNVTNVDRPTFQGTAPELAIVQLYAQRAGANPTYSIYLGQTLSGPDGAWSLTTPLLQDGAYTVTASTTAQAGFPTAPVQIVTQASPLIIDTVAPRVSGLHFNKRKGIITVVIQDSGSGLYNPSIMNIYNYIILPKGSLRGGNPSGTSSAPAISGYYSSANSMTLQFQIPIFAGHYLFEVKSGGIVDQANNPLDGEFGGRLPSGNGRLGGNFIAQITVPHKAIKTHHLPRAAKRGHTRHLLL
jgi:streptogramin lyase